MPKYSKVENTVAELRELADFIEKNGVKLPDYWFTHTVSVSLTETDYIRDDATGEYETIIKEHETKQNIKKFLEAVGSCEKDYRDDRIRIAKKYTSTGRDMIVGTADRSIACKKVVKGTKLIPATLIQARVEEEVEWVCDEGLSLKKLVANL